MPADKSADKLGSRMGVGERLEILCPVLFANTAHVVSGSIIRARLNRGAFYKLVVSLHQLSKCRMGTNY